MQQYGPAARKPVGGRHKLLRKPGILTEGPNIYQKYGWYCLMLAEGGTGWNHGISAARAREPFGPYEPDPRAPVITTRDHPAWWLQKAGHGELAETTAGEWYLAHLGSPPVGARRCVLERETCLQRIIWEDGWPRLAHGGTLPERELPDPEALPEHPWPDPPARDDFDLPALDVSWSSLRVPPDHSWLSLTDNPGWLRLTGRDSLHSWLEQSLLAKRVRHFDITATTRMRFSPAHFTQSAGLVCYYDTHTHFYLRVTRHEERGVVLGVVLTDDTVYDETGDIDTGDWPEFHLRVTVEGTDLQFHASPNGTDWRKTGPVLDFTKLSDDYGSVLHFTGAMIGLCVQDLSGCRATADFDYFEMIPSS